MNSGTVPELDQVMARLNHLAEPFRTRLIRAQRLELPEVPRPSAEDLRDAAHAPGAPAPLRAIAAAVAAGRLTWEDVAAGRADATPEMQALMAEGVERVEQIMHELAQEERRASEPPAAPDPGAPDDDFFDEPFWRGR